VPNPLAILSRLDRDPGSGVHLRPACNDTTIGQLQAAAERELGEAVPESFVRLFRVTNGVQINGAFFKEAENLVLENLDVPRPEIIALGNEGNMVEYVYDKRDRRFHTIVMGFPDEQLATFTDFNDMLMAVLREQQVVTDSKLS
jgi:hypothetical protein